MKKPILLFFIVLASMSALIGLTACGKEHEHEYELETILTQSICTEYEVGEYVCKTCGDAVTRTTDKLGRIHDWGEWELHTEPTCIREGWNIRVCARDEEHVQYQPIEKLGHIYPEEWEIVKEAGCFTTGEEILICPRCENELDRRVISPLPHSYLNGVCTDCGRRDWSAMESSDPDIYSSDFSFRSLEAEEKGAEMQALYLQIDASAREYHGGASDSAVLGSYDYLSLGLDMEEAVSVWKAYIDDHPLYYWLGRELHYSVEAMEILVDEAYTNHELRYSLNQMIYEKAEEWRESTDENAYLAALSYHDKIIEAVDYARGSEQAWAHNIVGVFEGRGAVCEGYARSFQLLLNMTGIENIFVTGKSGTATHAWNLVRLDDGEWYYFDLTYDDTPDWTWGISYNYFAVGEDQNTLWLDGGLEVSETIFFRDEHTPDTGKGTEYLGALPKTCETAYKGVGESLLRQKFARGEMTYAIVGYHAVQLIQCAASGDVHVPERVEYDGIEYEVISMGEMRLDGVFIDRGFKMYSNLIETLYIPATVKFLWTSGLPAKISAYEVAEENERFLSIDGVLYTKPLYTLISYPANSPRTEYTIPDGVKIVAAYAFDAEISHLRSFTIGREVEAFGNMNWGGDWMRSETEGSHSFRVGSASSISSCMVTLETLSVAPGNENYTAENNLLFNKDKTRFYTCPPTVEELILPASVERVEDDACWNNYALVKVVFEGDALKEICGGAFANCYRLYDEGEVIFGGTRAQWDAVEKERSYLGETPVRCIDD